MRIRSTKPEFWRSERVSCVDWEARLVLKGLESYVDDNGVGKDDIALIVGDIFQRDLIREPSRTLARVSEAISALHKAGLLHRYEVEGERLLYVAFWESVQRIDKPARGRFPRPDGTSEYGESKIGASLASPREPSRALAPGTGEQGNRGTVSSPPKATASLFDDAYKEWPKKVQKAASQKRWARAVKAFNGTEAELVETVKRFGQAYAANVEKQFTPSLAAWLNGERWTDELPEAKRHGEHTPVDPYAGRKVFRAGQEVRSA